MCVVSLVFMWYCKLCICSVCNRVTGYVLIQVQYSTTNTHYQIKRKWTIYVNFLLRERELAIS